MMNFKRNIVGFEKIDNYGPYISMPESLCMMKEL